MNVVKMNVVLCDPKKTFKKFLRWTIALRKL